MEIKDLMIGDLVLVNGTPHKIQGIDSLDGEIIADGEFHSEDNVSGIPLTTEILEKNGFVNMGFFGKLEIGKFVVICDTKNLTILRDGHCDLEIPIHFVHELQHALRLCGIEKEFAL